MQEFYGLTAQIQPFILNKDEFMKEKNEANIQALLTSFAEKTEKLKTDKMAQKDDMKFRAKQLSEGLHEAEQSFKNGFKDYSYWVLKSSLNNCYSCHTQKSLIETPLDFSKDPKISDFSKADYQFLVRNYSEAIPMFENLIAGYPQNKLSTENLETSLHKLLFYCVRVLHDDIKTILIFEKLLRNKELPSVDRNNILAWKNYLGLKKYRIVEELFIKDQKKLDELMKEREKIAAHYKLSDQRMIVDLETSHFLFKMIEQTDQKNLKPWLLFWAAQIEKNYRTSMFDLTAELYLKECMEIYPKSKAAQNCLASYKEIKIDAYTGSRGTELPKSVEAELKKYETLVQ
jgi:hypothetical protein